jgi:hypothetical protein
MVSRNASPKVTTLLLVAVVALSLAASAGAGTGGQTSPTPVDMHDGATTNETGTVDAADEVHVSDDGEVALVYRGDGSGDITEAEFGVDVANGLASALLVSEANTSGANGTLGGVLTSDSVSGSADLGVPIEGAANLTTLDLSANLTQTGTESSADASLVAVADADGPVQPGLETNGSVTVGADEFRLSARVESDNGSTGVPVESTMSDVTIEGTDAGYTVVVEEVRPDANATMWGNVTAANDTLATRFGGVATEFNGSSEVTIDSHAYENGTLDISYTGTLTGVKEGIARTVVAQLDAQSARNFTADERATLIDGLTNVTVEEISASQNRTGSTQTAAASVRISNYQGVVIDLMEISAARNTTPLSTGVVDRYRDTVAARASADLTQETTWNASVSRADGESRIAVETAYDSENWSAYVTELEAHGIDYSTNVTASLSAELVDDGIDVKGTFELRRVDLVDDALGAIQSGMSPNETADGGRTRELLAALRDSEFRTARSNVSLGNGTVTLRAGAQFEDVSALRNATAEVFGDAPVGQIYGQGGADGTTSYVYLGETRSVDELEAMGVVDNDTEVVENSTAISEFPRMNATEAARYLGVEAPSDGDGATDTPTPTDGDGDAGTPTDGATGTPAPTDDGMGTPTDDAETVGPGQPGFGIVVTAFAVALAALLVARRR